MRLLDDLDGKIEEDTNLHLKKNPESFLKRTASSDSIGDIVYSYEEYLKKYNTLKKNVFANYLFAKQLCSNLNINEKAIEEFSLKLKDYLNEEHFMYATGSFLSALIQKSYNIGNNDFKIYTLDLHGQIGGVCRQIKGNRDNLIKIKLIGNAGRLCCSGAKYSNIVIRGNASDLFGSFVENSKLIIYGRMGNRPGEHSTSSVISSRYKVDLENFAKKSNQSNKFYLFGDDFSKRVIF